MIVVATYIRLGNVYVNNMELAVSNYKEKLFWINMVNFGFTDRR